MNDISKTLRQRKIERLTKNLKTTPATVLYSFLFKYHTGKTNVKQVYRRLREWFPFTAFREINEKARVDAHIEFMRNDSVAKALVTNMAKTGLGVAKDFNLYAEDSKLTPLPYKEVPSTGSSAPFDAIKIVDELEQKELDKQDI